MAATLPFRRIIGIEYNEHLNSVARDTLSCARANLTCKNIELVNRDAAGYELPPDVTVIYFKGIVYLTNPV